MDRSLVEPTDVARTLKAVDYACSVAVVLAVDAAGVKYGRIIATYDVIVARATTVDDTANASLTAYAVAANVATAYAADSQLGVATVNDDELFSNVTGTVTASAKTAAVVPSTYFSCKGR